MPAPAPIDQAKLPELALSCIREAKFPQFATIDGDQPRLRPVSPVKTDGFTVYIANLRNYGKTAEIAANPKVELCYMSPSHDQVRITGIAEVLEDDGEIKAIWDSNALLGQYLGSVENPHLIIYRVQPERVRFMREWALAYLDVPLKSG